MRTIDRRKKSNIKCEHCGNFESVVGRCLLTGEDKNYWQKCNQFVWNPVLTYSAYPATTSD